MSKISNVVNIKSGYANFVELKSAYEETQENADRMAMYRPTKAHRAAFERICRGLYQPNDKKFYLLSGSYGTGKSHLCLMLANVLSRSSNDPEIGGFYENYSKLDPEKAKLLKNVRKNGQYLVAICDYHSGQHFEDVVMKAVFDACKKKDLNVEIETEFDEAERQLAKWKEKGEKSDIRNFYQDFIKALELSAPGVTVDQLRAGLKNYNSDMLEKFRIAFREMMGGVEFQSQAGNLIPIIQNLIKSQSFKERFKGLAIFFDEFGFTLEKSSYSKQILQGFMETICKNEPNVLFIGCIHKDFKSYADRFSQDDAAVMQARITQVDLLNEGIEEIIGAIVETEKNSDIWKKEIEPKTGIFDQLLPPCKSLDLFPWIDNVNRIRERVLEDIYGVHPMALSCLLNLSSEIGSDARSTFTFFAGDVGEEEGSYADYIKKSHITLPGGKLNLYTVNQLFTFFKKELSQSNPELRERQRQFINGYFASLDALRKTTEEELLGFQEDERVQLLRTILIYQLCQIPTNLENIQFGHFCLNNAEKSKVKEYLQDLVKNGAVFFRQQSKTYELAASSGEDPYDLIERFMADTSLHPSNKLDAFLNESAGQNLPDFIEAKGYNLPFGEDKRFRARYKQAKDLGNALWDDIQREYSENKQKPSKSFEGTLVYVLCEDDSEINVAIEAAKTIPDENIAIAVPREPQPYTDTLLKVKACRYFLPPNEAEKISAQTESRLRDIFENPEDGYLPKLKHIFTNINEGSDACWYTKEGKVLVDKPKQSHKPADMLCEKMFKKRCRIKHPDLNLCHDEKWLSGKNSSLKQAIAVLIDADNVFIDNGYPDNHGQKRYLEKVLLKGAGALRKSGSEGPITYFDCETNPDKINEDFPILKELSSRLENLNSGETLSVGNFLEEARNAPFGVGGTQLILALAFIIRAYGERLNIYKDSTQMIEESIQSYEDLVSVVSDPAPKTVFVIRDISDAQIDLIEQIAKALDAPPLKHGETRSLKSTFEMLKKWWQELPPVAKVLDVYKKDGRQRLQKLKSLMDNINNIADRFDFLLEQLPESYDVDTPGSSLTEKEASKIGEAFIEDVKLLNSGERLVKDLVAQNISEIFGTKGDIIECEKAVSNWYTNLSPAQRDLQDYENENAYNFLAHLADQNTNFSVKIFNLLPRDYGFGSLSDWTTLHIEDYAAKLKNAKVEIDKAKPVVYKPDLPGGVQEVNEDQKMFANIPKGASSIVYTLDGTDPRYSDSAKKANDKLNLIEFLRGRPNLTVNLRSVDQDGNYSDVVKTTLINKDHEYEIHLQPNLLGKVAIFKWPDSIKGLLSAMRSIIKHGVDNNIIDAETAAEFEALLEKWSNKK